MELVLLSTYPLGRLFHIYAIRVSSVVLPRRGTEPTLSSATVCEAWDSPLVPMTLGPAPQPVLGVEEQEMRSKGVISLTPPTTWQTSRWTPSLQPWCVSQKLFPRSDSTAKARSQGDLWDLHSSFSPLLHGSNLSVFIILNYSLSYMPKTFIFQLLDLQPVLILLFLFLFNYESWKVTTSSLPFYCLQDYIAINA